MGSEGRMVLTVGGMVGRKVGARRGMGFEVVMMVQSELVSLNGRWLGWR
jgi:hypothetical protein